MDVSVPLLEEHSPRRAPILKETVGSGHMCRSVTLGKRLGGGRRPRLALLVCLGKAAGFPGTVGRPKAHAAVRSWQLQGGEACRLLSLFSRL